MGDKPEVTFRAGTVSASVFVNSFEKDGESRDSLSISLQKSYQKDGEWKRTNSLFTNDLPKAILVLQKAYEYGVMGRKRNSSDDAASDTSGGSSSSDSSGSSSDSSDTSPF